MSNRQWREAVRILHDYEDRISNLEEEREQEGAVEQLREVNETAVASDDVIVETRDAEDAYYWDDGTKAGLGTWQ